MAIASKSDVQKLTTADRNAYAEFKRLMRALASARSAEQRAAAEQQLRQHIMRERRALARLDELLADRLQAHRDDAESDELRALMTAEGVEPLLSTFRDVSGVDFAWMHRRGCSCIDAFFQNLFHPNRVRV